MGQRAVLEVGLEEEQQDPRMVETLRMPLAAAAVVAIMAPAEAVPMAAAVGPKTVGIPVVQLMEVPVEQTGEPGHAGYRPTAEPVTLEAEAEAVPSSMETAPIPQGRWELQGTMVTEPEI